MGCDIHAYSEYYDMATGKWVLADPVTANPDYDPDDEYSGEPFEVKWEDRIFDDRNYNLFAILADVRNGRGFAGVETGEGFNPIAPCKGLPFDLSDEVLIAAERWGVDGHSHTYYTLLELLSYDWNQQTVEYGIVDPMNYAAFVAYGKPFGWSGGVSGPQVRHVENAEMGEWVAGQLADKNMGLEEYAQLGHRSVFTERTNIYTKVKWGESYASAVGDNFLVKCLKRLQQTARDHTNGDYSLVRFVCWFDN